MENEPGKPGTARVNSYGSGKFWVRTYALFVTNCYPTWVKLPILGKKDPSWVKFPKLGKVPSQGKALLKYVNVVCIEISLKLRCFEIGVIHALSGKILN